MRCMEEVRMNSRQIQDGISLVLQGMGVDLSDPNFRGTPLRVAKMYREMLSPRKNNWRVFPSTSSDLIILRGHEVVALCPHHLMPVIFSCYVGYIPGKKTLGLSKLARAVEEHLTRPILQEDLAELVARTLEQKLSPRGVGVVLTGRHGCMSFRGIRSDGDVVVSAMKGVLMKDPTARLEFLRLVGRP